MGCNTRHSAFKDLWSTGFSSGRGVFVALFGLGFLVLVRTEKTLKIPLIIVEANLPRFEVGDEG